MKGRGKNLGEGKDKNDRMDVGRETPTMDGREVQSKKEIEKGVQILVYWRVIGKKPLRDPKSMT